MLGRRVAERLNHSPRLYPITEDPVIEVGPCRCERLDLWAALMKRSKAAALTLRSRMGHDTPAGPATARGGWLRFPPAHAQKTPAAPAGPRLHISAVAFDRDDRPVADLRASDMEVWIGGFHVPIGSADGHRARRAAGLTGTSDRAPARRHDAATGPHPRRQGDRSAFRRSPGARRRNGRGGAQRQRDGEHGRPQRPPTEHRIGWPAAGHWRSACGRRWGACAQDRCRAVPPTAGTARRPEDDRRHRPCRALRHADTRSDRRPGLAA